MKKRLGNPKQTPWSDEEINLIKQKCSFGTTIKELQAVLHNRTKPSITNFIVNNAIECSRTKVRVNYEGTVFGSSTVVARRPGEASNGRIAYLCKCECGNQTLVDYYNLKNGNTTSCGCIAFEYRSQPKTTEYLKRRNSILRYYRRNAKDAGRVWELTLAQAEDLLTQPCTYCGVTGDGGFGGLDRIDNSKGYQADNVVSACKRCNQARNDQTQEEFLRWVERIYTFQSTQKVLKVA